MVTLPKPVETLRRLIAVPSISSVNPDLDQGNRGVVELLAQWLEDIGFRAEVLALPGHPAKANLIATLGSGDGGLVLSGHTDTVPYDEAGWRSDPFDLKEQDGRLYGLGACDMKGFFPLVLEAARSFHARDLRNPLIVLATADEESGMDGVIAVAEGGRPLGRYAVIGEPTGLRPVRMHKGVMLESIVLTGRGGHSSDPSLGASALEAMHCVMGNLLEWRADLQRSNFDAAFKVPFPTLNLGCIRGGDNPNRICARCELQIEIRPVPGMEIQELRSSLRARLQSLLADSGIDVDVRPLFAGLDSLETDAASPVVRVAEALTGYPCEAVSFGTEAPFLARLGMEPIVLGPGNIEQAHQPNEYLETGRLEPTIRLLRRLIGQFCVAGQARPAGAAQP